MEARVQGILEGTQQELIWLLEHPSIYTLGSRGKPEDILVPTSVPIYATGRGGQVTYHGPGQRVGYVLLNLKIRGLDPRAYVKAMQAWVGEALRNLGILTETREDRVGLWVTPAVSGLPREAKLVAIGIRIRKGVSFHGFSINLNPCLSFFQNIVPCGLTDYGVTSCEQLGFDLSFNAIDQSLAQTFPLFFS